MLVFLFNKHHASGVFSKYTFIQKTKDLTMGKDHKENGSSCCCAHGKKAKAKLDHLEFCLCCCLLPGTFLLCLAVESSSCYGAGCGGVIYGVWLAGEASNGHLLPQMSLGLCVRMGPEWCCKSLRPLLLGFFPPCSCSWWWQNYGSWSHIFDGLLCWMVPGSSSLHKGVWLFWNDGLGFKKGSCCIYFPFPQELWGV